MLFWPCRLDAVMEIGMVAAGEIGASQDEPRTGLFASSGKASSGAADQASAPLVAPGAPPVAICAKQFNTRNQCPKVHRGIILLFGILCLARDSSFPKNTSPRAFPRSISMRKALMVFLLLPIAACNREQPADAPSPVVSTIAEPATAPPAVADKLNPLKSPLPEGFELPFAHHRLYDNTGKTKDGKPQRRVMVEFVGEDAGAVQASLTTALSEAGFSAPVADQVDGKDRLIFNRADGVAVIVKIDPAPKRLRAQDARGTLHLTWDSV